MGGDAWRCRMRVRATLGAATPVLSCFCLVWRSSKLRNSQILNTTQKSPNTTVVETL
jgi:hypothetical protein